MAEDRMLEQELVIKEYNATREQLRKLYGRLVDMGAIGAVDPTDLVAAACNAGDSCHGGSNDIAVELLGRRSDMGARTAPGNLASMKRG